MQVLQGFARADHDLCDFACRRDFPIFGQSMHGQSIQELECQVKLAVFFPRVVSPDQIGMIELTGGRHLLEEMSLSNRIFLTVASDDFDCDKPV